MIMFFLYGLLSVTYAEGIVAGIKNSPVFWSEVKCRAKMEGVQLTHPDQNPSGVYIKKRVYDRLIVDFHRLAGAGVKISNRNSGCESVHTEAKLVLEWLQRQKKVWGSSSEQSLKELIEQLERSYDVSWR